MTVETTARTGGSLGLRRSAWALVLAAIVIPGSVQAATTGAGRWAVGIRLGDFLPADEQSGGFRVSSEVFSARTENPVKLDEVPLLSFTLGYDVKTWEGAKRWTNTTLSLELDVSRIDTSLGSETAFMDPDASTRVALCTTTPSRTGTSGDEDYRVLKLGDVALTPVFVNALFHWGSSKADFYSGAGLGVVFADATETAEYRDFVGDFDGTPDLTADTVMAADLKVGSNVRLDRDAHWFLFFEAQFLATQVLGAQQQLTWPGVDTFFGQRGCDRDGDNTPEFIQPADFRLIDPGRVRLDGATAGIGLRYRFGEPRKAAAKVAPPAAPEP